MTITTFMTHKQTHRRTFQHYDRPGLEGRVGENLFVFNPYHIKASPFDVDANAANAKITKPYSTVVISMSTYQYIPRRRQLSFS